jgi:hypothetical protein
MLDGGRIVGGIVILLTLGAGPAWVASVHNAKPSSLSRPSGSTLCIEPAAQMLPVHPQLLAEWRRQAVRGGDRLHHTSDGRTFHISLTGTCLGCHGTAAGYCDRCHADVGVSLNCWGCHSSVPGDR